MKYVRTKNGIYEVEDTYETKYVIGYTEDGLEISIYKEQIISQADTIEDLFMKGDLLVVGNESRMPIFFENIKFLRAWLIYNGGLKIKEFYIKHGIDYHLVAKINKKGVLELL